MQENNRNLALLEVIRQGLVVSGDRETQAILGNRANYLGLSDLARYAECQRSALLAKIFEQDNSLNRLLTLQRRHWFENGVSDCFTSLGLKFLPQLEINIKHGAVPIRGHLDFTLVWDKPYPAVRIVEVKSVSKLPEEPYPAYMFQAQAQVNLLMRFWHEPVFSLKTSSGKIISQNLNFPQICEQNLGIRLPDDPNQISVESWLLCLSMRDAACFGPYRFDEHSLENLFSMAENCWSQYSLLRHGALDKCNPQYSSGFNPLCNFCGFNADCPKFQTSGLQQQWDNILHRHEELKQQKAALDAEIRDIETALKQAHKLSGSKSWIDTGAYHFRVTNAAGRKTLDKDSLHDELVAIFCAEGLDDIDVDALFARHERTGAASERLNIMPLN